MVIKHRQCHKFQQIKSFGDKNRPAGTPNNRTRLSPAAMEPFSPQTFISRLLKITALFFTFRTLNVQMCQSRTCSCIFSFPLSVTVALLPLSLWIWSQIYFPAMKIIQLFHRTPRPPPGSKMPKTAVPPMTTGGLRDTTVPTEPHNANTESLIHSDCLRRKLSKQMCEDSQWM